MDLFLPEEYLHFFIFTSSDTFNLQSKCIWLEGEEAITSEKMKKQKVNLALCQRDGRWEDTRGSAPSPCSLDSVSP